MELRNREGRPVDPVPFLVVALVGATVSYAYFPPYLLFLGLSLPVAVGVATAIAVGVGVAAFYRYCWTARPDLRGEVPAALRFKRLVYGMLALAGVIALLALPPLL